MWIWPPVGVDQSGQCEAHNSEGSNAQKRRAYWMKKTENPTANRSHKFTIQYLLYRQNCVNKQACTRLSSPPDLRQCFCKIWSFARIGVVVRSDLSQWCFTDTLIIFELPTVQFVYDETIEKVTRHSGRACESACVDKLTFERHSLHLPRKQPEGSGWTEPLAPSSPRENPEIFYFPSMIKFSNYEFIFPIRGPKLAGEEKEIN